MFKAVWMTMKPQSFLLSAISASAGTALASLQGQNRIPDDADARTAQLDGAFGILFIIGIVLERLV
jgi:hypothetical protein